MFLYKVIRGPGMAQYVRQLSMGWTVWGLNPRFSERVQPSPGAHEASHMMGTGSFPRVEQSGHVIGCPLPSSDEVNERVELYLLLHVWAYVACFRGELYMVILYKSPPNLVHVKGD